MNKHSVTSRFVSSVIANILRAGVTFATGTLIARGLSPSGYGDLTFLLGSFIAIRALLDMGTSSAFYTFISRNVRSSRFYFIYLAWLGLQFIITFALIVFLIPSNIFERIWLNQIRETVALGFVAVFMQQQVWQMIGQIGESVRKTIKVQVINIAVSITYLILIYLLTWMNVMNVQNVLCIIIFLHFFSAILSYQLLIVRTAELANEKQTYSQILNEYWIYCKPMFWLAVTGSLYAFADKWMLQKFAGAVQQGYFQIASQFAQVSLLATVSIMNIFWKEIAEATARNDLTRVALLYKKISRGLVMLSAMFAGLLLPWSKQIVDILLGPAYAEASPVLAIMFLYPIHQSLGQIGGAMFMAGGHTKKYVVLSISTMLFTLPVSYFALAPASDMLIPGLELGAVGMAGYMVLTGVIGVNVQAWVIARHHDWQFDWRYQVVGIPLMIMLGFASKQLAGLVLDLNSVVWIALLIPFAVTCAIYASMLVLAIWVFPWLIGMNKKELKMGYVKLTRSMWHAET